MSAPGEHNRSAAEAAFGAPWLILSAAAFFWGGNAVAAGLAVGEISPMLLTFLRWGGAAALMLALFWRETMAAIPDLRGRWLQTAALGATGFACWNATLYASAVFGASPITIGIMQGAIPMIVLVGAAFLFGERIGSIAVFGVAVTFVGVLIVASGGSLQRLLALGVGLGDAMMLGGCLLYSAYTLGLRGRPAVAARPFFTVMCCFAALAAAPLAIGEAALGHRVGPSLEGAIIAAWTAVFPSALAQLFFLRGVDLIGPGRAGVYLNLIPVFAAILSVLVLGLSFEAFHGISMALVLGGLWLSQRSG